MGIRGTMVRGRLPGGAVLVSWVSMAAGSRRGPVRRCRAGIALAAAAVVVAGAAPAAGADVASAEVARGGAWGNAVEVPGLGALNAGGTAEVDSVSCGSPGSCAAGGDYVDASRHLQVFVVNERHGVWGTAIEVPGLGALNAGGAAEVGSVSCGSAGSCAAGGSYRDGSAGIQGFVVSERHGVWGTAVEVPGLGTLSKGGYAAVSSVSCGAAGSCAAGGDYLDHSRHFQAFVVSERNGVWGTAVEVPGLGALNAGNDAGLRSVSCGSAGSCAAGGYYSDRLGHGHAFVVTEKNGLWGKAIQVPGTLNMGGNPGVSSVSCGSAGSCAAGGSYQDGSSRFQAFVVTEEKGVWGTAIEVPGLGALNTSGEAAVSSVSCASAGNCAAGGYYEDGSGQFQVFVVSERHGVWGTAVELPGLGTPSTLFEYGLRSVSCGSADNCEAAGSFADKGQIEAFVVGERHGAWGTPIELPGLSALNTDGFADIISVSCAAAGRCAAGGYYDDSSGLQGFVASRG